MIRSLFLTLGIGFCALVAPATAQHIAIEPSVGEVGSEIGVQVRMESGEPIPEVRMTVVTPSGGSEELGATDAQGVAMFTPSEAGLHQFRGVPAGSGDQVWIASLQVREPRSRWLLAVLCVPAGLVLLWWNFRRLREPMGEPGED